MKWVRRRKQKQKQKRRQEEEDDSSTGFSLFRFLPLSWVSKLKPGKSGKNPSPAGDLPEAKQKPLSPEFHPFVPPAIFHRLVGRRREEDAVAVAAAEEEAPRRHSCATADDVRRFERSRGRRELLLGSARFDVGWVEPDFPPLLSCRSCRAEPLSPPEKAVLRRRRRISSFSSSYSPSSPVAAVEKGRRSLEGFAVVKRSRDPQRDFRESMVEMIERNRMGRAEELEGLLACYLALNADEYHDVIVRVFRQLWLEMDPSPPPSR